MADFDEKSASISNLEVIFPNPNILIFAGEPSASAVLTGNKPGSHIIQGIGAGFIPSVLDTSLIDEIIPITDDQAIEMGRQLARKEGLLSGVSSGAVIAAALKIGQRKNMAKKRLVAILASFGERYLSTSMFNAISTIPARNDGHL